MLVLKLINRRQMKMENMQTVLRSSAYQVYEMAELLHNLFKILSCKVCMFLSFCLRQMHFLHVFESAAVHLDSAVLVSVQMLLLHTMGSVMMALLGVNIGATFFQSGTSCTFRRKNFGPMHYYIVFFSYKEAELFLLY